MFTFVYFLFTFLSPFVNSIVSFCFLLLFFYFCLLFWSLFCLLYCLLPMKTSYLLLLLNFFSCSSTESRLSLRFLCWQALRGEECSTSLETGVESASSATTLMEVTTKAFSSDRPLTCWWTWWRWLRRWWWRLRVSSRATWWLEKEKPLGGFVQGPPATGDYQYRDSADLPPKVIQWW